MIISSSGAVKANTLAAVEDRLSEEELIGQMV